MKQPWSFASIFLLTATIVLVQANVRLWEKPMRVFQWDIKSYYAYLPAAFIYQDISLEFTREDPDFFSDKFWPKPAPNGGLVLVMSMGLAMLYLPFFLMGHFVALISGAEATGYSPPYAFFILLSGLVYLIAGLFLLRKLLLRYFSDITVALVLVSLVLGTNLFWYASLEAPMTHVYSFALFSLFLVLTASWYDTHNWKTTLLLGLLSGLIVLIRPANIVLLIFFVFYGIGSPADMKNRLRLLASRFGSILLMGFMACLVWLPQLIYWKLVSGQWFYYSYTDETFFFRDPQIISGLFSFRKGWLLYTPLMIAALAGIPLLRRYNPGWLLPVLLYVSLHIYVVFSWWTWWYGGGFGQRPMIETYAILAFPLGAIIHHAGLYARKIKALAVVVLFLLLAHNLMQTVQYYYGAIHWDSMSRAAYFASLGRPRPLPGFQSLLETPDYQLAKQGIYKTLVQPTDLGKQVYVISCTMEHVSGDPPVLYSDCGKYSLSGALFVTERHAYSGNKSVMLRRGNPDGLLIRLPVTPGEEWRASVLRRSLRQSGALVVSSNGENGLYGHRRLGPEAANSNKWDSLYLTVVIPEGSNELVVYARNNSFLPAWFDNMTIEKRIQEQ